MKFLLILSGLSLFAISSCKNSTEVKKIEITEIKTEKSLHLLASTNWFQTSAEARALYYQSFNLAKMQYDANVKSSKSKLPKAVVTDLDETILDNSPFQARMISENFEYSDSTWDAWVNEAKAGALPGAVDFYNYVKSKGGVVISLSNRTLETMEPTLKNMKTLGLPFAEKEFLYLKPKGGSSDKSSRREEILKKYDVVLYLGDNLRDFSELYSERAKDYGASKVDSTKGDFGKRFIVMPNPMYGEWEKAVYGNSYKHSSEKKDSLRRAALRTKR